MMLRNWWNRRREIEAVEPPILVGVPGSLMGIEVPFLPRPGRLHIIVPYACDAFVDLIAMQGMRWACCIDDAA